MTRRATFLVGAAALLLSGLTSGQTYLPGRTGSVILGDRFGDALWRLDDLNLDGDFIDAGEITSFYTGAAGPAMQSVQDIAFGPDGTLYMADSGPDTILALTDVNLDGDADDAGENSVYFDSTNASGILIGSPMGVTVEATSPSVVWIANSSNGSVPDDILIRCRDNNGDGDANDAGESRVFWNKALSMANGGPDLDIPAGIHIDGSGRILLLHGAGSTTVAPKGVYLLQDVNGNFDANDAGEVSAYFVLPTPAPVSFDVQGARNGDVYIADRGTTDTIFAVRDVDGNGTIAGAGESNAYWFPGVPSLVDNMVEVVEFDGTIALLVAEDSTPDRILRLEDASSDGVIQIATEQSTAYDETSAGVINIGQPKAIEAMPGPFLEGPPTAPLGTMITVTHTSVAGHLASMFMSFGVLPTTIPPYGVYQGGPAPLILFSDMPVPASGRIDVPATIPNASFLVGLTFILQTFDKDGSPGVGRLSNPYALNFQ